MADQELQQEIETLKERITQLSTSIETLQLRNQKVDADKAWETSLFRITFITLITYVLISVVFWLIDVPHFLRNALIPTIGYILSTQSIPKVKHWWMKNQ